MQKFCLIFLFALLTLGLGGAFRAPAQAPAQFQWASALQPTNTTRGWSDASLTAIDAQGNSFLASWTRSGLIVDGDTVLADTAVIERHMLVKYSPAGQMRWSKQVGLSGEDLFVEDIASDADGNLYVTGVYGAAITLDTFHLTCTGYDYFVVKYAPSGAVLWAANGGGSGDRIAAALAVDPAGNVVVTGAYFNQSQFGSYTLTPGVVYPVADRPWHKTAFVLKLNATGVLQWAKSVVPTDTTSLTYGRDIAVDRAGNIMVAGVMMRGRASLFGQAVVARPDSADRFWVRLTPAGAGTAALRVQNPGYDLRRLLAADDAGNSYLLGANAEGAITRLGTLAVPVRRWGTYLARISPAGAVDWVHDISTLPQAGVYFPTLSTDWQGKLYVGGYFSGHLFFGNGVSLHSNGRRLREHLQGFVAALNQSDGAAQWALAVTGTSIQQIICLDANDQGEVAFGGRSDWDTTRFDGIRLTGLGAHSFLGRIVQRYNTLSGTTFVDTNLDGQRGPTETGFPDGVVVETQPGSQHFTTRPDGGYDAFVQLNAYQTSIPAPPRYHTVVPLNSPTPAAFTTFGNQAAGGDFALRPQPGQKDLLLVLTPLSGVRPGFPVSYRLTVRNVGTASTPTGAITLTYAPALTLLSSTRAGYTQSNSSVQWAYQNLAPNQTLSFNVLFQLATTAPLGSRLSSTAIVDPLNGDLTPADNSETLVQTVTGAYDPNDIVVNHLQLTTQQVAAGERLDYTIHFRNLGTDTAFSVIVRDTLPDALLNLGTLQVISVSHSCQWTLSPRGVLTVQFPNIRLTPYTTNTIAADGFVRFRVRPAAALVAGDQVPNRAVIHFDYNAPLTTNTALTAINQPTGLPGEGSSANTADLAIWPNPATGALHVEARAPEAGSLSLMLLDALGRPVLTQAVPAEATTTRRTATLDISGLPVGLYLLRGTGAGTAFTRRVVVR